MTRRRFLMPLVFAALALGATLLTAPPAEAQAPSDETFESADGVKLHGRFYKAQANKNDSCVLLVARVQEGPDQGGLGRPGEAVGQGGVQHPDPPLPGPRQEHRRVRQGVLRQPVPRRRSTPGGFPGRTRTRPAARSQLADLKPQYAPMLVNDVMAARAFLERKNDTGEVNVSTMYLIGAGEACPLGLLYIAAEWHREAIQPNIVVPPAYVNGTAGLPRPAERRPGREGHRRVHLADPGADAVTPGRSRQGVRLSVRPEHAGGNRGCSSCTARRTTTGKRKAKYFYDEVLVAKGKTEGRADGADRDPRGQERQATRRGGPARQERLVRHRGHDPRSTCGRSTTTARAGPGSTAAYAKPLPVVLQSFGINPQ